MRVRLRVIRARAVWCAIWFGVMPWWVYEDVPHYDCGYLPHLRLNLGYAWMWLRGCETDEDREFERTVNTRPNWIRWMGRGSRVVNEQIHDPRDSTYEFPH